MKKNKVLLIGWDAADWDIIWPLIAQGKMPALKSLIERGVYGNMSTMNPPYSPMLWTSVATGKTPDKHGVLGFIEVTPDAKSVRPVTTTSRKTRALWNIFHNKGLQSNLVGWWPSFPVEPINGTVISDRFQKTSRNPKKQTPMSEFVIHPWEKKDEFKDLRMFPFEITQAHLYPFVPRAHDVDQDLHRGLAAIASVVSQNTSVHNAATKLLRTTEWDFMAVYYDMIDHFCHSFMKYHPPRLPAVDKENYDIFKEAVTGSYIFQDMMLDRKLKLIDKDTTVIVMSDHGFESGEKRILDMPKVQAAPSLEHRQFGMFVAAGPNIKENTKVFGLGLIDVAPTILHHYGYPIGKDMDGKVMLDIFKETHPPTYIDSWDDEPGDFGDLKVKDQADALSDAETMEQLVELGYVDKLDEKFEVAIKKTRIDLKHNLARVYLGKKDFSSSKKLLLELLEETPPIDLAPFYMDLISLAVLEKEFVLAKAYLQKVKESNTEINYNLDFTESHILSEIGRPKEALAILNKSDIVSGQILYKKGTLNFVLGNLDTAIEQVEKAIEKEPEKATYYTLMAEMLLQKEQYEEAVEYALTSIEIVKYFPKAHLLLGQALEKLGDFENAKIAYEMANSLRPKEFHKAKHSLENIIKKIELDVDYTADVSNLHYKNQIAVVSGLPRSGTSLMMQMLDKGGVSILQDTSREADISNPKGYYEYKPVMSLYKDNSWLSQGQDKAVKVVAPLLKYLDPALRYKIIFMRRDLNEIVQSQQKMIGKSAEEFPVSLYNKYQKLLSNVSIWEKSEPGVEMLFVNYKNMLENPGLELDRIEKFLGVSINKEEMANCVDISLYRNRA
ncbi:MAG: putative AlkP superfamily phosphohydrolase/phosphomutase/tetratricopeptide (TPR) repeat protein [Candidatus Paceibacteria bacterium]|jgi:predicted AlkP superfamily phosphohydrolase/phosphomutase/tetratricopeptide (TPR) repeat protein